MSRARRLRAALRDAFRPLDMESTTSGTLTSRGALSSVGLATQGGLRFLTSWLIFHLGDNVALGVVQSAISTATLLALLWPTTTGAAASKFIARARGSGDTAELRGVADHLRRRTLQAGSLVGFAAIPAWVILDDGRWGDAVWVAVFAMAYSGYSFARGVQFGSGQVLRATLWDVMSAVIGLAALTVALAFGIRGTLLLAPLALSYALYTIAGWPWRARGRIDRALRRDIDHLVMIGVAGTLASTGFLQLAMIVAKATGGNAEAGQFAAAMVTATPASLLASSLSLVLFPTLAEAWGRGDLALFNTQTDRATRALILVMVAVFGSMILCSQLIMRVVWGPEYDATSAVFPILVGAILATNIAVAASNALATRSTRGLQVASGASVGGLIVGALLWWTLTPHLGILGVAIGYCSGAAIAALIPIGVEWRIGGHAWHRLAVRLAAGLAVLVALFSLERALDLPLIFEPLVTVAFMALWAGLSRRDLQLLPMSALTRRRS